MVVESLDEDLGILICTTLMWLMVTSSTLRAQRLNASSCSTHGSGEKPISETTVTASSRAKINHLKISQEDSHPESDFGKNYLNEFFKNITDQAIQVETVTMYMNGRELYHEVVSISAHYISESIIDIIVSPIRLEGSLQELSSTSFPS